MIKNGLTLKSFLSKYSDDLLEGQNKILQDLQRTFVKKMAVKEYQATLVRMPTGTGKTGVIAAMAYFANYGGNTLVLTPWANLCNQLESDLKPNGFWKHISLSKEDKKKLKAHGESYRLKPRNANDLLKVQENKRILLTTFNSLQSLHRKKNDEDSDYESLRSWVDLIVVDEGHYEPAVLWGQAIKELKKATLILTATPYRNDLKLFKVDKANAFHYTHNAAKNAKKFPLRKVQACQLKAKSDNLEALLKEFMEEWNKEFSVEDEENLTKGIICCANKKSIESALELVLEEEPNCKAFHQRVDKEDFKSRKELGQRFLKDVPNPKDHKNDRIWIHQNKLTEGLDEPLFRVLLITYPFKNDRKLVQQIGRILRHKPTYTEDHTQQTAYVYYCADFDFKEIWDYYLQFEQNHDLITDEHYKKLIKDFLLLHPPYEYFGKRFRKKLEPFSATENNLELQEQIKIRPSVQVSRVKDDFNIEEFIEATATGLRLDDAILLGAEGKEAVKFDDHNTYLWLYARIANADILIRRSAYEISINARFVSLKSGYLFIGDTSGKTSATYLNNFAIGTSYFDLAALLNEEETVVNQASLFNTQSNINAVRINTRQGANLSDAPMQLSEKAYVLQNLTTKRKKGIGGRYLGLTTGRIRDRFDSGKNDGFNLVEFDNWSGQLAKELNDAPEEVRQNFFKRYAKIIHKPDDLKPYAIILDTNPDLFATKFEEDNFQGQDAFYWEQISGGEKLKISDTVFEFVENTYQNNKDWPFRLELYTRNINGDEIERERFFTEIFAKYDASNGRIQFKKGTQTQFRVVYNEDTYSVAKFLNVARGRYMITLKDPSKCLYHDRQFFKLDYKYAEANLQRLFDGIVELEECEFEKIPSKLPQHEKEALKDWPEGSLFQRTLDQVIPSNFSEPEWIFCDDPNREIADFIVANFKSRRVAFIHCKMGKDNKLSASAFHDICSQASKNLVYIRTERLPPNINTWSREAKWTTTQIPKWSTDNPKLAEGKKLWQDLREKIIDHPQGITEVWLVMGKGLSITRLLKTLRNNKNNHEIGPLIHMVDGLHASCIEANVKLKVYGHDPVHL